MQAELGYTIYREDRPNMSYSGVMIAVSNYLISTEATKLNWTQNVRFCGLELTDSDYLAQLDTSLSRL